MAETNVAANTAAPATELVVPLAAPTTTVVVDASAPPQTFTPEIAAHAATLGVDLNEFSEVAPDVVSRMLTFVERSAGRMALNMLGQPAAMPNPAPAAPAPAPEPVARPKPVPVINEFKFDFPDPDKMDEAYGEDVKQLARGMRALAEDHNRRFSGLDNVMSRALPAIDDLYNERLEIRFDEQLSEVVSAVPSLATIYGTGSTRKLKEGSEELKSRQDLHRKLLSFSSLGSDPVLSMRIIAQASAEKKTGQPTTPARNDKGQFVPTQTTPPVYGGRQPTPAAPVKPVSRDEVVRDITEQFKAKLAQSNGVK